METTSNKHIQILADLLYKRGVRHAVVMPGSRNAPISIALNRQPGIECHVVVDERCGGFLALGMAQYTRECVAVVCTSGTAVLDLSPAVAEAYYQSIPLLVISADRPEEWIDQDDSQTIRQNGILSNFVKKSFCLPMFGGTGKDISWANRVINDAVNMTMCGRKGPVHLNVPLDIPLYELSCVDNKVKSHMVPLYEPVKVLEEKAFKALFDKISNKKVMLLAGFMPKSAGLNSVLNELATKSNLAIMAEGISNLCGDFVNNNVESFFSFLLEGNSHKEILRPEVLIVVGGALVSKSCKKLFRENNPGLTIRISPEDSLIDTFKSLDLQVDVDKEMFFKELLAKSVNFDSRYSSAVNKVCAELRQKCQSCSIDNFDEEGIFRAIYDIIPEGSVVHLSNGTSVRYGLQWQNEKRLELYSNRGTSGIDGCTSTAVGSAMVNGTTTTLITGDLSFLYDSNSLWNDNLPDNLVIVIINNHGGGIFSKMKGPREVEEYEKYFYTPQKVNVEKLSSAYGIDYYCADNYTTLKTSMEAAYAKNQIAIVDVSL